MIETIRKAWKVPELRKKLLYVAFILVIFRLGNNIPVPFINTTALQAYFNAASTSILGLMNVMSGGSFWHRHHAGAVHSALYQRIHHHSAADGCHPSPGAVAAGRRREPENGNWRPSPGTAPWRWACSRALATTCSSGPTGSCSDTSVWAAIVIIATFTAGSVFVMWLGEQITGMGIGNGISILLFAGIISRLPSAVFYMYEGAKNWAAGKESGGTDVVLHPAMIPVFLIGMILMLVFIVYISLSERKIPVQYAKRVVGRKMYGGQATTIPIKVNMSGVMPIIFAQTIASIPATIAAFVPSMSDSTFIRLFDTTSVIYCVVYALLIVGFSYFYATIQFNPVEVSNNLKKQGGFIPGYRAGRPTAEFLSKILNRITLFGAIYLAIVAILPIVTGAIFRISALAIGGTSVLIVVSVALDTQKSLEANMMMKQYKGFLN